MRTSRIAKSMSSTSSHWMPNSYGFYGKAEDVEVRFYGCMVICAYSERNDINTEQLVFVSLKIKKKTKQKRKLKKKTQPTPGVDRGTLEQQFSTTELCRHQVQNPKKITVLISINYKTSDNSTGSSLYEDFLLVNFLVL